MLSTSAHASSGASTGVLTRFTAWDGRRTELVGLAGTTWPVSSQSNRCRIAARRSLTVGAAHFCYYNSIKAAT
jgi:hypothetical protein